MTTGIQAAKFESTLAGKYRILGCIGQGGMGSVYEAVHIVIKRRFALKFLRADLAQNRSALARFQREAEAAGALENENIAQTVDFGIADDGAPYIIMEYLTGCDLARLLRYSGPLPIERAADLAIQACRGIQAAHAAGVIHRDLKPANLFIVRRSDQSDLLKILDFGIAKLQASDAGQTITSTGGIFGTPAYMSPEQARGSNQLDERVDIYALGVILYEMLSGHLPHPGDSHNAMIYHISTQPALRLNRDVDPVPAALCEAVMRALATDPAQRQASVAELAEQLMPFARRTIWPALRDSGFDVSASGQSVTALSPQLPHVEPDARTLSTSPVASSSTSSRFRIHGWKTAIVAAGVLGALFALWRTTTKRTESAPVTRAVPTPIESLAASPA